MSAVDFLAVQLGVTGVLLWFARRRAWRSRRRLVATLAFTMSAGFFFDYVATDRGLWAFAPAWGTLFHNPVENVVFTGVMTVHAVAILELARYQMTKRNR